MPRTWPVTTFIGDFTAGPPNPPSRSSVDLQAGRTALRQVATQRGRQYELGVVQAGTMTVDLTDSAEYLNPANLGTNTNLLSNSGFESGITPWAVTGGTVAQSSTQKHSGSFAAQITPTGSATQTYINSEQIPVTAGASYVVSCWAWCTNAVTSNFSASVNWFDAAHGYLSTSAAGISVAAATWTQVSNTFAAPPAAAYAMSVPTLSGTPAAGQIFYVDDATLWPVISPTSPWNTGPNTLLPYRCLQFGAYWNAATLSAAGNVFNSTNRPAYAAGSNLNTYDPSFESGLGPLVFGAGSPTIALSTAQKFDGLQSAAVTFTATADIVQITAPFLNPGAPVTFSVYVYAPAGTTLNVAMGNAAAGGATIASAASAGSGAWQRLVVTGAPSAPTVVWRFSVTGTAAATVYLDAMQLEFGSAVSAFTTSGPTWNAVFTGYIERYPQTWDSAGFRGLKPLVSVDALSPLSRIPIRQSYAQTVLADNPAVYIPYNDQAFPQAVQRPAGGQQMIGYTQLGSNSGAVNFAGDTFLDGSKAVTLSQQNTSPVTNNDNTQLTYLGTRQGAAGVQPDLKGVSLEVWIKYSSGVIYLGAASMNPGESTIAEVIGPTNYLGWLTSGGILGYYYKDPAFSAYGPFAINATNLPWSGYPDGLWHQLVITIRKGTTGQTTFSLDGVSVANATTHTWSSAVKLDNFFTEAQTYYGDPVSVVSVANLALYPYSLSDAQVLAHYQRGSGYLGEKSGTRANRILTQYWGSNIVTDTGKTAMSTDFYYAPPSTPGSASQPKQVLSVLQDIAATEGGLVWADGAGKVHFDSRETRYTNSPTPRFTFGENTGAGELPYDGGLRYEYDGTYVYSEADLTGGTGTQLPPIVNTTSQTNYGQRILSATLFMASDWDVQQAGQFYVQRYSAPPGGRGSTAPMRISKITINPAENPNLWQAALSLDIGARITVKRRTSPGTTMTGDYYIEQVSHNVNAAASTWTVDYQLSPVWNPQVWILGDNAKGVLGSTSICVY